MTNKLYYFLISILCLTSCKTENKIEGNFLKKSQTVKIDTLVNRYHNLNRFNGVILVSHDNSIVYDKSFGLADYENNRPFSNKTTFKIGKLSELITARIIHGMAENNNFQLSDRISKYLPEIDSDLTINDLLNHQTNLPSIESLKEEYPDLQYSTIDYANLSNVTSTRSEDSELDYNILGELIENISNKSFQENVTDLSEKVGLENTYFEKKDSSLAVGYLYHNYRGDGLELQTSPQYNPVTRFSSQGIKSTPYDLKKIIDLNSDNKLDIQGYLQNDGFSYSVINNPETNICIIVLSNFRHPVGGEIAISISAIIENKEYNLPLERKRVEIDKSLLKDYSGLYSLNEQVDLEVIDENDSLFVMMGPNKIHLIPQSSNQFFMEQMDASMRFLRNKEGLVNEVVLLDGFLEGNKIERK